MTITVGVIFGGRSSEHAISCISAAAVLRAMDRTRYQPIPIGITENGAWVLQPDDPDSIEQKSADSLPSVPPRGDQVVMSLDPNRRGVWIHPEQGEVAWQPLDIIFPVLHGPNGEDGSIQGLCELAGMPFVGSGVFASAACMDKGQTKTVLARHGIPVGDWFTLHQDDLRKHADDAVANARDLGLPVFVKPARAGSSMGVAKVSDESALVAAAWEAAEHDPRLIVEASVEGAREIECGVLQAPDGSVSASRCAEIVVQGNYDFYNFEAKYLDDSVDLRVPADLPPALELQIQECAVAAFRALACEGLARVDFLVAEDGTAVLNEVNTMPGFTPISMYPQMWAHSGVDYQTLISTLIEQGRQRPAGLR